MENVRKRKKERRGLVRGLIVYVYNHVTLIRGREKIPELSRTLLRFSVMVCVRILAFLGMASFRG